MHVGGEGEGPFDNKRDDVKDLEPQGFKGKHAKRNNRSRLQEAGAGPIDIGDDGNDPGKRVPAV